MFQFVGQDMSRQVQQVHNMSHVASGARRFPGADGNRSPIYHWTMVLPLAKLFKVAPVVPSAWCIMVPSCSIVSETGGGDLQPLDFPI